MTITYATRSARQLAFPRSAPAHEQWIYQLAVPFQISPTEAALSVNIRLGRTPVVDLEVGGDILIFDDLSRIDDSRCLEVCRGRVIDHPRTGEKIRMVPTPPIPGFIPLGAKRPDGSPHPHAGTGFAVIAAHGYPVALADSADTHIDIHSDVFGQITICQLAYDGRTLCITDSRTYRDDELFPGTRALFMSMGAAIAGGDDLVSGFNTGSFGSWNSDFVRWRRDSDGRWKIIQRRPMVEKTHEPSLVRDVDGSLLMLFRPWPGKPDIMKLHVERSTDEGETWQRVCEVDNFWQMCPMTINTALDGTPYIMANRFREPRVHKLASREMIWAWALSKDRQRLEEPYIVRDASTGFGPPPNGSVWRIDHPMGRNLRLKDGKWRHVVCYRGLEDAEMRTDAGATDKTGLYVEEMFSDGPPRPEWLF